MSIRAIQITGTPVLHSPAAPVADITGDIRVLIDDMIDTMHNAPGVGLAAPQVGVGLRIFVWHYDDGISLSEGEVINPSLQLSGWRKNLLWGTPAEEGCLSIPGERSPLARYPRAILTGLNRIGEPIRVEADGWLARIFQHEFDHLNGVLYRDRLRRDRRREIDSAVLERGWGTSASEWTPGPEFHEEDWVAGESRHSEEEAQ